MNNLGIQAKTIMTDGQISSVKESWPKWRSSIEQYLGPRPGAERILQLGSELSRIWSIENASRDQSGVSKAGTSWEVIVSWYLNLVFWNSGVISTRWKKDYVPQVIRDALTVKMGNLTTLSETDVVVYGLPEGVSDTLSVESLNQELQSRISELDVTVLQLKTSWSEFAQIPMLWDLLYRHSADSSLTDVRIGVGGHAPHHFNTFNYSFATVPTQKGEVKPNSVRVKRVANLSGGNYWGHSTKSGVALSLAEFPSNNCGHRFDKSPLAVIQSNLNTDPYFLTRFLTLDFSSG